MDQERYWMWTKRKTSLNSHVLSSNIPSYGDSWEEQAFAEDAAGPLGGCIWPPRSYTCTFCRREFRSAQALGGHMNVHRRDRARLKQNPSPNRNQDHPSPPSMPSNLQYNHPTHDQIHNPNLDFDHLAPAVAPTSASRVSLLSPLTHGSQKFLEAPMLSSSKLEAEKYFHVSDSTKVDKGSKALESNSYKVKGSTTTTHDHHRIKDDLSSVNLNSVIRQRYITTTVYDHREESGLSCKRRKTDETLCFFPKKRINSADDADQQPQSEVLDELSPTISTIENLDLELRLGDRS